jgi:hypothetical protein
MRRIIRAWNVLATLLPLLLAGGCSASGALSGTDLRCEYRHNPLGIDSLSPRFGWVLESNQQQQRQTAYRIIVASDPDKLSKDIGDLWDTGKIDSTDAIQIPYLGKPLQSNVQCFWKVRVWDRDGRASPWSAPAEWTMGLLKPDDWHARWIGRGDEPTGVGLKDAKWIWVAETGASTRPSLENGLALFRKSFVIGNDSVNPVAWLILAATGPATAYLDGQQIGVVNDPRHALTFDLSPIFAGRHALSVVANASGGRNGVVAAIVHQSSGGRQIISTDNSWEAALEPGSASNSTWPAAKILADYSDKAWGKTSVEGPALPILRKEFAISDRPKRAIIYICGLGQFELHVNGRKVSEDFLQPGWTDYRKTCLYCAYDVAPLLKLGRNAIGVMLGNGMYNVTPGRYVKFLGSFGSPQLIAQLLIEYPDGTVQRISTDETWKFASGPITFSNIYGGEDFDAQLDQHGWDQPNFYDAAWSNAVVMNGPGGELRGSSRSALPIRVDQVFEPVKITPLSNGDYVYDVGQNCSLVPAITVRGPAGAVVKLTPGELLDKDGSVSQRSSARTGAWDTYTLSGLAEEHWSPRFTYFGSRYIQVHGAVPSGTPHDDKTPEIVSLQGQFITSSSPQTGEFSCSNDLFNRTARLIEWAIRSNSVSTLTDCPHRERLGWLEQDHLMGPALLYSHDIAALLTKICGDMRDSQHVDGLMPEIAPEYTAFKGSFLDSPEWGSACVLVPWNMYQWYGDKRLLAESIDSMKRYVDYLGSRAKDNILSIGLSDWYDVGPKRPGFAQLTPVGLTATAFYYRDIQIVAETSRLLGHDADAQKYDHLARMVADAFNKAFYHPADHYYVTNSQTANAMPIVFGLAPKSDVPAILDEIVADMKSHNDSATSGDVGYHFLLRALADNGRSDEIFTVNNQCSRPGYGYQLAHDATSLEESWDANTVASQDHFMLGHLLEWFYHDLAGIQQDPGAIGFERVVIKPQMVGDVTWVKARYDSIRGPIVCEWERTADRIHVLINLPPGVSGTVYVPARATSSVTSSGDGASFLQRSAEAAVFEVQSGTYQFSSP